MSDQSKHIRGVPRVIAIGVVFGLITMAIATKWNPLPLHGATVRPDAYRVPKIPGGTALRMAMVHDVLHERYLRHGTAWYTQRNKDAQKILDSKPITSDEYLNAMDDLAVGHERVGAFDEGIALMRKKAEKLSPLPATTAPTTQSDDPESDDLLRILASENLTSTEHHQYTACANLGTILLIKSMGKAIAGDKAEQAEMRESLQWVERAIAINPGGHFGRERWQAILIEHLLAAIDHPEILTKFDMVGDPLGDFTNDEFVRGYRHSRRTSIPDDDQIGFGLRLEIRGNIRLAGIYPQWQQIVHPDYTHQMPFDEPTLAIIGMWTMGGGPNPHFALALGRLMDGVEQNQIAWNAYERAVELKDSFWPDPAVRDEMVKFCRARQNAIANIEDPTDDNGPWQSRMRKQHQAELAWGQAYQNEYQDYEARQIAAGVPLDDPNFYIAFFKDRPPIASDPGLADDLVITHPEAASFSDLSPMLLLGAGIGMFIAVLFPERKVSSQAGV